VALSAPRRGLLVALLTGLALPAPLLPAPLLAASPQAAKERATGERPGREQLLAAAIRRAQQRGASDARLCAMAAQAAAPGRDPRFLQWLAGVQALTCGATASSGSAPANSGAATVRLNGRRIALCSHGGPCHSALLAALRGRSPGPPAWIANPYGRIPLAVAPPAASPASTGENADER
jgi:hypothetical protein